MIIQEQQQPLPQLVLLVPPTNRTKNYRRKIRLINENGCICAHCYNVFEVDELALDHICPKFMCSKEYYRTKQNRQLLCKACHRLKSAIEGSIMVRIIQKIIESIHINNRSVINISEIIQQFKALFQQMTLPNTKEIIH